MIRYWMEKKKNKSLFFPFLYLGSQRQNDNS